ncbi:hypothetical protein PGTUg99_031935 [Puccinia graminis f. sp. tritici]|uniref:Uncharacterized protein n=1 Tax=Puccinia graminis f. sp. tritici TaxID=56615 RepID=A0A5B0SM18_PUCGR|nr:hypothetical protein PGTUg99_031935 [Puccinia graminis f. sp. tritici]
MGADNPPVAAAVGCLAQPTAAAPLGCWTLGYTHVLVGGRYTAQLFLNLVGGRYTALHPLLSKPTSPTAAQKKPQLRITPSACQARLLSLVVFRRRSWSWRVFEAQCLVVLVRLRVSLPSHSPTVADPCSVADPRCSVPNVFQITIQQSSNINQITGNSNMEHQSKRIRKRIKQGDDSESSNPPPMKSNEGESAASGANPVGPDSMDEQHLEHAMKLAHNQVSSAYASYEAPTMSDQKDKFDWYMIAWKFKT